MGSYTWNVFPLSGTANFEGTARTALEQWRTNASLMDNEITTARSTYPSLNARLDDILGSIPPGTITYGQLDILNAPTDTYQLTYNLASDKMEWVVPGAAADPGDVRFEAADPKQYLNEKLRQRFLL